MSEADLLTHAFRAGKTSLSILPELHPGSRVKVHGIGSRNPATDPPYGKVGVLGPGVTGDAWSFEATGRVARCA